MPDYFERRKALLQPRRNNLDEINDTEKSIQLASLVEESIVDGPGIRFTVFTQGCPHRCPGCHNPSTHLNVGGSYWSVDDILAIYDRHPTLDGMTLSGGEPFEQAGELAKVAAEVHARGDNIITYTGYRHEVLKKRAKDEPGIAALLAETDLLIDGRFMLAFKTLEAPFVGSSNQRLIALSEAGNAILDTIPLIETATPQSKRIYFTDANNQAVNA